MISKKSTEIQTNSGVDAHLKPHLTELSWNLSNLLGKDS